MLSTLTVVLPVLNEAGILETALTEVLEQAPDEIVVVDGGSQDATCDVVRRHPALHLIKAQRGRAAQMNAGAAAARSDILLFLHADAPAAAGVEPCPRGDPGRPSLGPL